MERELRILHLAFLPYWSALAWHAVTLAHALGQRGHRCWVGGGRDTPILERARAAGLSTPRELELPRLRPWNWLSSVAALRGFLLRERVDAVCVHTGQGHFETHLARRGLPVAIVRVCSDARASRGSRPRRWLYRAGAERVAATGRALVERQLAALRLPPERVAILPPAVDARALGADPPTARAQARAEIRRRYALAPEIPLIGMVGRLSPVKGHAVLIAAAGLVAAGGRDFGLLIVGAEKQVRARELRDLAQRHGIAARLIVTGFVSDPWTHAAALDVGAVPSLGSEEVSRSALEFMACGVPVVASAVGILPEVLGESALLVPAGDARALAGALEGLLADPLRAARVGERLYARVREEYAVERLAQRAEELIHAARRERRGTHAKR